MMQNDRIARDCRQQCRRIVQQVGIVRIAYALEGRHSGRDATKSMSGTMLDIKCVSVTRKDCCGI
jgi:hypothetical protein